jgi:ADP-dependent NAD(P)H-hydrate dehydratase
MSKIVDVDAALLARMSLPEIDADGDKNARGSLLVVGGGRAVPGAALLTGRAGLRAGAGKLQIATSAELVSALGVAMPEARIHGLATTSAGELARDGVQGLCTALEEIDAIVLGPGMIDEAEAGAVAHDLLGAVTCTLVLDAGALTGLSRHRQLGALGEHVVMTPHAGELAALTGWDVEEIKSEPVRCAERAVAMFEAVLVLKGAVTHIASPHHPTLRLAGACPGLATSGSGDVLAGLIGGLLARGADCLTAAVWSACAHARAGQILTERIGETGFLAREIANAIPEALMHLTARTISRAT